MSDFEIESDSIVVRFRSDGTYVYDHQRPGARHVEKMKLLAERGEGLAAYINKHVRKRFARKLD